MAFEFDAATARPEGEFDPSTATPTKPAGAVRRIADTGLALGRGIVSVPEAAVGLADLVTGGRAGKAAERAGVRFKDARQVLTDLQSDEQKAADAEVQKAEGFFPTVGAMVQNPSTIVNAVAESAPSMLAGGAGARALVGKGVGGITAGAAGEGAVSAGQTAEQVRQESATGFLTPKQATIAAGSGALTGVINRASGSLANKLGISDVNTAMATGKLGGATEKGVTRRVAEGAANEGILQELPQSMQEQAAQNLALDKPVGEGVGAAGAQGMLVGGLTGGAFGAVSGSPEQPKNTPQNQVPPDRAGVGVTTSVPMGGFAPAQEPQIAPKITPVPAPQSRARAMGINQAAGPISNAATIAVDTGADVVTQQQEVDKQKAEAKAKEKAKPGKDGKKAEPEAPAPVQPVTPDPTAPVTGPFTFAQHGEPDVTPPAPPADVVQGSVATEAAGPAIEPAAAPRVAADQGQAGAGPAADASHEPNQGPAGPVTQESPNATQQKRTGETIDPETGEITQTASGASGARGDNAGRAADALDTGADAKGAQPAAAQPAATAPGATETKAKPPAPTAPIDIGAHTAATSPHNDKPEPTDAQKEAGNYRKGAVVISGVPISVENPQGSVRSGTDADGKDWSNTMEWHYGYANRSVGSDGEQQDVFIKPGTPLNYRGPVHVVDQIDPRTGKHDEYKSMVGGNSPMEARKAYHAHYAKDWKGFKRLTAMSWDQWRAWLQAQKGTAPESFGQDASLDKGLPDGGRSDTGAAGNLGQGGAGPEKTDGGGNVPGVGAMAPIAGGNATTDKSVPDGREVDAHPVGNVLKTGAGVAQGNGSVDRPGKPAEKVSADVVGLGGKDKVVDGVVQPVLVPVVDDLGGKQRPADSGLHDKPVLKPLASNTVDTDADKPVGGLVAGKGADVSAGAGGQDGAPESKPNITSTESNLPAVPQKLFVSFAGKTYPVESIEDAQRKWIKFQETGDGGAPVGVSKVGNGVQITDQNGKFVARISFNGRVWDGPGVNAKVIAEAPRAVPDQRLIPVSKRADPEHIGRDNRPLAEGGKPFKTNRAAKDAKKNQPMLRVVRVAGGFALAPKTDAQIAAQERNAKRLAVPRFGNPGVPLAAHEFIVGKGGLAKSTRSDMVMEGNTRVGNRFLFAAQGGLDMDSATELLKEAGYLPEGASMDDARNLIRRSLNNPQYTSEGIETMAERELETRRAEFEADQEAIALAQEAEDNELDNAVAAFDRAILDIPGELAQSDMSMEDALLVAGYTQQELENERVSTTGVEADQGATEAATGESPQGDRGREGTPGQDSQAGSQEGLTAPTRADILAQQAALEAEEQRKKDGGDKPAPSRPVTGDTPDIFNTQGSVFDQPVESDSTPAAVAPVSPDAPTDAQAEYKARIQGHWDEKVTPAIRDYLRAFDAFGVARLERNKIKPEGMSAREWLESFVTRQATWDHGRKTGLTGIQYLSVKDLWPTGDEIGERLRKAALEAVKALKNAPASTSELMAEAFMEKRAAPATTTPSAGNPDALRAQADLQSALADLADIFGKNTRATIMPEQEQKLLPVLVKVFDAAFRLGYHKFKDAAKFALDQIRKALGDDAANAITLDHLQGAYISMAGGKTGVDTKRAVIGFESIEEITGTAAPDATEHKVGDLVKLTKPGVNGPVNIAGRIERILPDGRLEIRTQQDGIFKVAPSELGHKPTSTQTAPATPADGVTRAAAGGQFGKNGEWYEGGQILPTSEFTIKGAQTQPNGPRNDAPTTDTTVEVTPAATLAGSGLVVEQKTSARGKTYWSVSGDTLTHKDLLDALGFAKPFKMGGKWSRSVFDADPTERLSQALQGNMPAPKPELPSLPDEEAAAVLRQNKIEVIAPKGDGQVTDGIWTVAGKGTFDAKDTIKKVGGRWNGQLKAWSFEADPTGTLAYALKERGSPGSAADDAGPGESDAEIERRRELRQREDARDDERADAGDASQYVAADTQALILRGEQFGIPRVVLNEQIEDIGLMVNAHQKGKPLFLLANEAGTGKTMVLGGAIRELRARGESKFVYVTMNTDLIAQIKKDLKDYGIDDVDFHTYSELSAKGFDTAGSILIFDEAHNVKNVGMETARANKAQDLIAQAKMTIMASATLFENPVEARYLASTGIFDSVGGFPEWAKMYGASVKVRKFYNPNTGRQQTEEIIYWAGRGKKEDGAAARAWLFKQAIMTQRAMKIEPGMVDVQFRRNAVDAKWVDLYDRVQEVYDAAIEAWTDENGMPRDAKIVSEIARHRENTVKRVLEASKTPFAIKDAQELLAAGRNVVIFVETKADRTLGKWRRSENFKDDTLYSYEQMQEMMAEWKMEADMARMQNERAPQRPFAEFIYTLAGYFDAAGLVEELPSTADQIVNALGADKVGMYTGAVSNAAAGKNKTDFLAGRKKVLVATMAKGGTGLSLHDIVGNRPTTQININLPWKATGVDQVAARVARYGLRSKTEVRWLFASNIPWESQKLAPRVGARMRDMGAIVKGIEVKAAEVLDGNFDFEGDLDVKGGSSIGQQDEGDIYAKAVRMQKLHRKADDTSGGFFETPFQLAALMTKVSGVRAGHSLLEPSAGKGNLLRLLPDGVKITAVEQREDNYAAVSKRLPDATVQRGDFMEFDGGQYDTVLMNPPFERIAGVGAQDVAHVMRAYGMLKDGGRMAAIMGEGAFFRDSKQEREFREWLDEVGATVIQLPEGAFKQSGTGVRTRMVVIDKGGESGRTDLNLQDMDPTSLKALEALVPSRYAVEGAAIARDGAARYDVNEPDAPYETDIFGDPLPQAQRSAAQAKPAGAGIRGNVQPATGVQDTPATAGEYFTNTIVGSEVSRELGAGQINKPEHAATATQYLYKSAVERLDGIVTDKAGKVLGVVGGFKGAVGEASVYPATLVAEAVRIPGAANIWFSHNHPSGLSALSRADERLNETLSDVFRGSGIEPRGLMAVTGDKFSYIGAGGAYDTVISGRKIVPAIVRKKFPVIERELSDGTPGSTLSDPQRAKQVGTAFYDKAQEPGIMLLNSQNQVAAWIPIPKAMMGLLRNTGQLSAIYRAVSQSNAGAAVIVHGGELNVRGNLPSNISAAENIGAALKQIDVRVLDIIDAKTGRSAAETGQDLSKGPVYARSPFYSALTREVGKINGQPQGLSVQAVRQMVDPVAKKLGIEVRVVATPADLPIDAPADARGLYLNGTVYVVAGNNASRADVLKAIAHEAIAHLGLRSMLGREGWHAMMNQMQLALKMGNKPLGEIRDYVRRTYVDESGKFNLTPAQEADEIAARAVEMAVDPVSGEFKPGHGWAKALFARVAQWLREHGFTFVRFSNLELQGMLVRAVRNLERGADRQPVGQAAAAARGEPPPTEYRPQTERRTSSRENALKAAQDARYKAQRAEAEAAQKSRGPDAEIQDWMRGALARGTPAQTLADVTRNLREATRPLGKMSIWEKTVGTQYHKATRDADFKRVFDGFVQQTDDTAHYAIESENMAPDILMRLESMRDVFKGFTHSGAKHKANLDAVSRALFANIEGKEGLKQVLYDDQSLRQIFNLTPKQIEMYRQARAAVDTSVERLAQTYAAQLGQNQGMSIDSVKNMALDDTIAMVKEFIQDAHDEARAAQALRKDVAIEDQDPAMDETRALEKEYGNGKSKAPTDDETAALLERLDAMAEHVQMLKDAAYMPALRFGEFAVTVTSPKGETEHFEMFESKMAANLAAVRLAKEYPGSDVARSVLNPEQYAMFKGVSPETVELFAKFVGADQNEAYQQYIALAKSARSVKMRQLQRKGIAGFSEDATRVLASFVTSNARQSAVNMNIGEITNALASKDLARKGDVQREAQKLADYMSNPLEEARALRGFMFMHFMGGSIASALVNLTQPIMQTAPYLHQFAAGKTARIMLSAAKMAATGKIDNAVLRHAVQQAAADGITEPHEIHQLMADANSSSFGNNLKGRAAVKAWGSFFSLAEAYNRRQTFIAAYMVAQETGRQDAYEFARKAVIETQGMYNKANRPNWARGAVGATIFTFKQFSIAYIEWFARLPPKQKALAMAVLMLAAGADGLPFADDIDDLIDTIGQTFFGHNTNIKRAKRQWLAETFGDTLGEIINTGLASKIGVDVSGRLGMGNLLPGTALLKPSETDKTRTAVEFAGPLGGLLSQFQKAAAAAQKGEFFGLTGAAAKLAPTAVRNLMMGADMATTGTYKDTRGYKVADVNVMESFGKMLGLQPASIALQSRKFGDAIQDKSMTTMMESMIADRWAAGIADKNPDQVARARKTLQAWNETNQDSRIAIKPGQVMRRVREMGKTRDQRFIKTIPRENRAVIARDLQ